MFPQSNSFFMKNKYYLFIAIMFSVCTIAAKEPVNPSCGCPYTMAEQQYAIEEDIHLQVDKQASFRNGEKALLRYQRMLIQNPAKDKNDSTRHSILCRFIVEKNGRLTSIELLNKSQPMFEEEALRFIETMPKWTPAEKGGKPVRAWHYLRLFFGYPSRK